MIGALVALAINANALTFFQPQGFEVHENQIGPGGSVHVSWAYYPQDLESGSIVRIVAFDSAGEFVATVFDQTVQPFHRYAVEWNGTTQAGAPVASGVYVLAVLSPRFVRRYRVTIVR